MNGYYGFGLVGYLSFNILWVDGPCVGSISAQTSFAPDMAKGIALAQKV